MFFLIPKDVTCDWPIAAHSDGGVVESAVGARLEVNTNN